MFAQWILAFVVVESGKREHDQDGDSMIKVHYIPDFWESSVKINQSLHEPTNKLEDFVHEISPQF